MPANPLAIVTGTSSAIGLELARICAAERHDLVIAADDAVTHSVAEGGAFLEQDFDALRRVIDTNVTGTLNLLHRAVGEMVAAGKGRGLITESIAAFMPGSYNGVYNASKAFIDSFSFALRDEIKDSGVTVTCPMPGATDTEFSSEMARPWSGNDRHADTVED